ncbi:hypothetical protein [Staphylococcus phage vB_SepM_ phiIPLA-C1C]|uniref:Uncharacterized protein n=5 Tax=Sepunavirus TaxID=1980928 RepID=W5R8R0_9CAUD|nr:hypothetical protein AVU40_gp035 [Staphylococcus phage phiIPLA-C1C]YP_009600960.1 hypothetical protein FDH45_gp035 [Staphylococcus phage phiIBB-SEP1]AXF38339.1 hypothetical protein Quidividi_109 [Staphylococcus phage Quidividi]MDU7109268.1 hypothetical protein [Clostridium perfringens]WJJ57817.1 hypothetical protein 80A_00038 [Staphylococcus phage 80A]WJJ58011.1 hypothetical protein 80B_00039 [Staphylococcus phage 80B]WJJ58203.1 hypothetical protein 110_00039 [Staphylococcus phage 110]
MRHEIYQTASLLRFLNNINLNNTNIQYNLLDERIGFVSRYYTPNIQLSELAQRVLNDIQHNNIKTAEKDLNKNSIVNKIDKTMLKVQAPRIYFILQTIIMESYAIVNCFVENIDSLVYLTERDVKIARENLNYVADYLSDYEEYSSVVTDLRELDICFGYIELQLPLIKKERGY